MTNPWKMVAIAIPLVLVAVVTLPSTMFWFFKKKRLL